MYLRNYNGSELPIPIAIQIRHDSLHAVVDYTAIGCQVCIENNEPLGYFYMPKAWYLARVEAYDTFSCPICGSSLRLPSVNSHIACESADNITDLTFRKYTNNRVARFKRRGGR